MEHVDVLRRVEYVIRDPGGREFRVVIEIGPPPAGRARVVRNTIPRGAPGSDALTGRRRP